jgi:hypothetical protein
MLFLLLTPFHGCLIISRRLALLKADRPRGAVGQAVAESVAEVLSHQLRFAVDHVDRALVAGLRAESASVAFFLVDMDDFAYHFLDLLYYFPPGRPGCEVTSFGNGGIYVLPCSCAVIVVY